MGTLYLVRHGQASFGAADYDQLSALGALQCQALGQHLAAQGLRFDAVYRGSLKRHVQSLDALAQGFGALPPAQEWPGLNEYDSEAVVRAVHPQALPSLGGQAAADAADAADAAENRRQHMRLLRDGLLAWVAGTVQPQGLPKHADWVAGVMAALHHAQRNHVGKVLVVSSGGPISNVVAQVLGAPAASSVELNLRLRNSSLTELVFSSSRLSLLTFNQVSHLQLLNQADVVTYA